MRATIIFILFFFSCVLGMAEVSTPFEAIRQHREWMSKNTPKPETLSDEDLMLHAQQIIDLRLQEPEAFDILVAASKKVPEVEAYINWTATLDCDTLFHRKRDAFRGMADFLDTTHPGCYAARKIRTSWLGVESIYRDVIPEFDKLIKEQEKTCNKNSSKREKALLLLMRMAKFQCRATLEQVDNPLHYPEMWEIEDEVLKLYPIASSDIDADRIDLYTEIASLKSMPQTDTNVRLMLGEDRNPFDDRTMYQYTGKYRDYQCNSGYYLEKALDISSEFYGEFHPANATVSYFLAQFRVHNTTIDEDIANDVRSLNDYFSLYHPSRSLEAKTVRILKALTDQILTGNANIDSDISDILDVAALTYGTDNTYYLNTLSLITTFQIFTSPDYKTCLDNFENQCKNICHGILHQSYWLSYNYSSVKDRDPEEGVRRMAILKDNYLKYHDGSAISVTLGNELADFYNLAAYDPVASAEIHKALLQDVEKLYGRPSAMYYQEALVSHIVSSNGTNANEINNLNNLIKEVEKEQFTGKNFILGHMRSQKASYFWQFNQYENAHKAYQELFAVTPDKKTILFERIRDAECRVLANIDKHNLDAIIEELRKEIDNENHNYLSPVVMAEMGYLYNLMSRQNDAIEMFEKSLEAHNYQTNESFDDEYLEISQQLASLYETTGNRVAAARMITKDREFIRSAHNLTPTPQMVNYVVSGYYRAVKNNDFNSAFLYLSTAWNLIGRMFTSSGKSDYILYTSGVSICQAFTHLVYKIKTSIKEAKESMNEGDFAQFSTVLTKLEDQFRQFLPTIRDGMSEMEKKFPSIDPDYKNNPNYSALLQALGIYHVACEPDLNKAETYMRKVLEVSVNPIDRRNACLDLAGIMKEAGDSIRSKYYTDMAFDITEANIGNMSVEDKTSLMAYRFNYAMDSDDIVTASKLAKDIYSENRKILDRNFQLMSSTEQDQFFNSFGDPAWALTSVLEKEPVKFAADTYNAIVFRTGMQLRSQQELRKVISTSNNPEIRALADSIAMLHAQRKQINITPEMWGTPEGIELNNRSAKISFTLENLEMQLLDITADIRAKSNPEITWQMVRDALKPSQVAVEFLFSRSHIMALVLTPGCDTPQAVTLCKWKELSDALDALKTKNSASLAKRLYRSQSSVNLYSMLWEPLESILGSAKTVYFNAPGILHSIAFNAIETPDGNYLIDKYDLRQLTTTAQITFPSDERAPQSAGLLGDVIFDPSQAKIAGIIPETTGERAIEDDYSLEEFDSRGVARQYFRYLPFTGKELKEISSTFGQQKVKMIVRENATEGELRNLCATSPEVLHLATHGFFISSEQDALHVPFMKRYSSQVGSAMQRSGVALANAEATWKGSEELPENNDGILTANEVSNLNLKNTRLVTLSACETALGAYNFEGIHGLTRGFKQAGAKSLLVSLWSVNDESTATFMTEFYRHWIENGDRHAAYRSAVAAVREKYPSPFYWAPFILLD